MALPADVDYSDKNVRVYTRGLRATVTALEAAGVDAQDMKTVFRQAGEISLRRTEQLIPVRSGKLRSTVRMSILKNKASIRIGRSTVPYAARIEFGANLTKAGTIAKKGKEIMGETARKIPGHFFLREAIRQTRHQALTTIVKGLTDLFHKHNLGDPPITISGYIVRSNSKAYSKDSKYLS